MQRFDVGALGGANFALSLAQFNTRRRAEPVCPAFWGGALSRGRRSAVRRGLQHKRGAAVCSVTANRVAKLR